MPKAKPVSLHPLTFDEAIKRLVSVDPGRVGLGSDRRKPNTKRKSATKRKRPVK